MKCFTCNRSVMSIFLKEDEVNLKCCGVKCGATFQYVRAIE